MVMIQYKSMMGNALALFEVPDAKEKQIDELFAAAEESAKEQEKIDAMLEYNTGFDFLSHVMDQLEQEGIVRIYIAHTVIADYL